MRWLSLTAAFVLLIGALIAFYGGLGPLIAVGEYSEGLGLPSPVASILAIGYLGVLFGGIICCMVCFRGLGRAFESALDRPLTLGDWCVFTGHCALVAAIANIVLWRLRLWDWDLLYLLLMVAAALYSFGLGALALTFRPGRIPPQAAARASGASDHAP